MSKRAKFILVTWVGPSVSVMKKAKMSTDKALVKDIIQVWIQKYLQILYLVRIKKKCWDFLVASFVGNNNYKFKLKNKKTFYFFVGNP